MTTTKKRIMISLPKSTERLLRLIAKREQVPPATKALELIEDALELEEDMVLSKLAEERDTPDAKFVSYEEAWKMLS
jgi:predicted DNA-binding protein